MNDMMTKMTLTVYSLTHRTCYVPLSFTEETNWRNDYPDEDEDESCDSSQSEDLDHSCFSYRHKYQYGDDL